MRTSGYTALMDPNTITWIYIVLLVVGGMMGYLKARSQVSLFTGIGSAVALLLTVIPNLLNSNTAKLLADVIMIALLIVFTVRLAKTQKFMPAGMMLVATIAALALRHIRF
jgi:uncharacterized membrane protein (UPF0136 family)